MKPIILIKTKNDISNDSSDQSWSEIPEYVFGISSVTNSNIKSLVKLIVNKLKSIDQ